MRPASLSDVAELALRGDHFDRCLASFLDGFYAAPQGSGLAAEPGLLAPRFGELGQVQDAYLAAVAEDLARRYSLAQPSWTFTEARKLRKPWFASPLESLRTILLLESPAAFRTRNLFVSENALSRV